MGFPVLHNPGAAILSHGKRTQLYIGRNVVSIPILQSQGLADNRNARFVKLINCRSSASFIHNEKECTVNTLADSRIDLGKLSGNVSVGITGSGFRNYTLLPGFFRAASICWIHSTVMEVAKYSNVSVSPSAAAVEDEDSADESADDADDDADDAELADDADSAPLSAELEELLSLPPHPVNASAAHRNVPTIKFTFLHTISSFVFLFTASPFLAEGAVVYPKRSARPASPSCQLLSSEVVENQSRDQQQAFGNRLPEGRHIDYSQTIVEALHDQKTDKTSGQISLAAAEGNAAQDGRRDRVKFGPGAAPAGCPECIRVVIMTPANAAIIAAIT